jgi:UPF0755 protein
VQRWARQLGIGLGVTLFLGVLLVLWGFWRWQGPGPARQDTVVMIPAGSSLKNAASTLEKAGVIADAQSFLRLSQLLGSARPIRAGEYQIPKAASAAQILRLLQKGQILLHQVLIAEGMSSLQVYERLLAEPLLKGSIAVPAEGSVLPETYSFTRGEERQAVLIRMQQAMARRLETLWNARQANLPLDSPAEAVILASIVEKETSKKQELAQVAGVYINRLRLGMPLQADPTVIYPITKGKPLGRRIRQSELRAQNGYNTYVIAGLPQGPIANPSQAALSATLNPQMHDYLFFVADGTGGHIFAKTYAEHQRNVLAWRQLRREKGF